jgi:hypothetical protein
MSMLPQKRIGILQRRSLPFFVLEIIRKEPNSSRLLAVPASHSPQSLEYGFLFKRKIEKTTVDGILHIALSVLVPSNIFELCFLWYPISIS